MVITDSGGLQKESFFSNKKCIVIRDQTEWIELINQKVNLLSNQNDIYDNYKKLTKRKFDFKFNPFGDGKASEFILNKISNFNTI